MSFTTSELQRIKAELGYNVLSVGADAYIQVSQLFEVVVNSYIDAEVSTTSSTAVTASGVTQATITLASATGFNSGARIVVDVDSRREMVTIQSLSGADATALFSNSHTGTYPVALDGPIPIAKEALHRVETAKVELARTFGEGALRRVDEIEFYDTGKSLFGSVGDSVMYWRDELASALGVPNLWRRRRGGGSLSVY